MKRFPPGGCLFRIKNYQSPTIYYLRFPQELNFIRQKWAEKLPYDKRWEREKNLRRYARVRQYEKIYL